jgi:dTMP kinase
MSAGFFLAVEGTEGAGKSTLISGLDARFRRQGIEPLVVREPGGTPLAERIRQLLLDPGHAIPPVSELYLFLSARADLVARVLRPALSAGRTVVADRFALSTEAYQAGGRGLDLDLVRAGNRAATGGLVPDLTLVLDLPPAEGLARIGRSGQGLDRIEREDAAFHGRVADAFARARGPDILHLDGSVDPERVLHAAWTAVAARHPTAAGGQ